MMMINSKHPLTQGQQPAQPSVGVQAGDEARVEDDDNNPGDNYEEDVHTRAAFNLLRQSYDSTAAMIQDFLGDFEHRVKVNMLILCGEVLHHEYTASLSVQKNGQFAMVTWQAQRAAGKWCATLRELLDLWESPMLSSKLDLPRGEIQSENVKKRLQTFVNFTVELCHARAWSQLPHSLCFPNAFIRVFVDTETEKEEATSFLKKLYSCFVGLDEAIAKEPNSKTLKDWLEHLIAPY